MAPSTTTLASLAVLAFCSGSISAQILASYPLANDLLDATTTHGPVSLFGTTTGPADGVCVAGTYGAPNQGDELYTPSITAFNEMDFQIDVDFKLPSFATSGRTPVLVGSRGWRFIGLEVDSSGQVGVLHNNAAWLPSTTTVAPGEWNWATIKYDNGNVELLINGVSAVTGTIGSLSTNSDYRFTTTNYSNGRVLDGCVRNIVIANDATIGTPTARAADYGTGCGAMSLTADGLPTLGNLTFEYDVVNPTPTVPLAWIGFGFSTIEPGMALTTSFIPNCFQYTDLVLGFIGPIVLNPTSGDGSLTLPIPNAAWLAGTRISAQAVGFNQSGQLASSNGTRIFIGN